MLKMSPAGVLQITKQLTLPQEQMTDGLVLGFTEKILPPDKQQQHLA
jgi:hypothetical protein